MNEETTQIEKLIEDRICEYLNYSHIKLEPSEMVEDLQKISRAFKTHREKYKHTKEDVIKAMVYGAENEHHFYLSNKAEAEQYYNETHKNQD